MSDFQHRHYAHVAAILAQVDHVNPSSMDRLISDFADMFAEDNERFDRSRFRDAALGRPTNKDKSTARRRMGFAACGGTR